MKLLQLNLSWLIQVGLVLGLALMAAPPAAAYWPPCQNITGPALSADWTKVEFSVYNPATGQTVPGFWDIPAGYTVDQLTSNQGIAACRAYDGSQHHIYYATYDPARGWMSGAPWVFPDYKGTSIRSIQDGVVWAEANYTLNTTHYSNQFWWTYDPGSGLWRYSNVFFNPSFPDAGLEYYSKNGVVAIRYNYFGVDTLAYQVYDPIRATWQSGSAGGTGGDVIQYVSIDDYGTIHYTLNGTNQVKGYSVTNGVWQDKSGYYAAELYAAFVAQPVSGNAPLTVWVTDMSLGAWAGGIGVTFAYNWGDGASSPNFRSGFYTYSGLNKYTLSHTVTRGKTITYASDTRTTQIITKPRASLPFTQLLLLDY